MNIEQLQKDLDNGVLIPKIEWAKLVKAALIMDNALEQIIASSGLDSDEENTAYFALKNVDDL